ncbi:MAG: DUF6273 domain-containing protein [Bacilli bacterium]
MKLKYKVSLITIIVLFFLALYVAFDYSKYKDTPIIFDGALVLSDDNLSINYSSGDTFYIKDMNNGFTLEKKFSVTNMGNGTKYYVIAFNDIEYSIDNENTLTYSLISNNGGAMVENAKFPTDAKEVTELVTIAPEVTQSYTLKITYTGNNSNDLVKGTISVKSRNNTNQSFSEVILKNNEVKELVTKPGKEISTNNEGLIKDTDDEGQTYFFRGDVKNNYVRFADQTWRIVRINGDNSIRLILDDVIENTHSYNTNKLAEGDTNYYTLTTFDKASIKEVLDSWYDSTILENAKYVVNSNYCMDTNLSKEAENEKYFRSYVRVNEDEIPLYNCIGTKISNNIGLLSLDEAVYAGSYKDTENKNTYLYNPNITKDWWLGSPYSVTNENVVKVFTFTSENGTVFSGSDITSENAIRPVINIRDAVNVTGTGTEEDPYVIE